MKKYELVIFDCDGTLVDSESVTCRVIEELINEIGISISYDECFNQFTGKTLRHITDFIKQTHPKTDETVFESEYRDRCKKKFREELEPVEGVVSLLENLSLPFCVASNGPRIKMEQTLPAAGLDHFFPANHVFSAYDIQSWKPQPDLFLHAAEQMNISPSKALVIEDTWSGVMGAVNGDIDVWAYNVHLDSRVFINGVPNFSSMYALATELQKHID